MDEFYAKLAEMEREGVPLAVATVVRVRGSVPREVGAKMVIHPYGQHYGTVGGGCGEADVIRAGMDVIHTRRPRLIEIDLTDDVTMQSLGVCGGVMDVFIEPWPPQEPDHA
ncbi:hypothetical protein ARMA_2201 [Ardenticatena maritima]|uniref:Sulfurylase small subunit, molybdopterin cytosine dinucleotide biosynthesis n=1 Tax=Ardenticatena maritima TaxID=872965 RepID=A0A0M9UD93_9CHLR|nr:XdhC family protein [Ardenticatena maritima]KPL89134.1 sulfurylase small subunit, molybdopterin cytosine dinucleotide biosynthesis [Ardenticatena maritima]GAP63778.1 hypothetical protein ARMA_2201 [Ardenticatena maritima]